MSTFIQLHLLTSYPPSNLNRDDLGRPKTAIMGGEQRLRISSQSLKRAWRTSDVFKEALSVNLGKRTRQMGREVHKKLLEANVTPDRAGKWAETIAAVFGKAKKVEKDGLNLDVETLVHFGPEELRAIDDLVARLAGGSEGPTEADLKLLQQVRGASDIAMFGRMLAADPAFNVEAAVQVAHAITVHAAAVEDDFFSAVDDLNKGDEDRGSGHMGEVEFGAGLFYLYVCINRDLLVENLGGDVALASRSLKALVAACSTVSPTGKQNSFGSRAYASYILAERGTQQPRSLSVAFLKPIADRGRDPLREAITALSSCAERFDKVYGACADARITVDQHGGTGSLDELSAFVAG